MLKDQYITIATTNVRSLHHFIFSKQIRNMQSLHKTVLARRIQLQRVTEGVRTRGQFNSIQPDSNNGICYEPAH